MECPDNEGLSRRSFIAASTASAVGLSLVSSTTHASAQSATASEPGTLLTFNVNGQEHRLALDPRVTLLDAVRDHLGLTGTKKGCDMGTCGACTVLVNGRRILSCFSLAVMHEGDEVTTIEGLASGEDLHPLQAAFIKHDGFQCGYCTPGQIVSAAGFLNEGHALDRDTIRMQMSGNICRCGCYPHIVDAIAEAGTKR